MADRLTEAQRRVLKTVKQTRERPSIQSDDWDIFLELSDKDFVEDCGLGNARITPAGRSALAQPDRKAT